MQPNREAQPSGVRERPGFTPDRDAHREAQPSGGKTERRRPHMLQAWITSPRGSLYFAAPATAYNLETLRTHVRALRDEEAHPTCLSLNVGDAEDGATVTRVSALVTALT